MSNEIDVKKFGDLEENVIQKHHSNFRYLTPSNLNLNFMQKKHQLMRWRQEKKN